MRRKRLGRTGLTVSEICLGTMTFGSMADEATSLEILDKAFDAGVDFIDLAEIYPVPPDAKYAGRSEEICGKWLRTRARDAVIVATKASGPTGGRFRGPVRAGNAALDRHHIARAVEASLQRLGTDYIDLYQTHWPDPDVPMDETLEALDRLREEGKIRYAGCSNESAYRLAKSLWTADRNGVARFETIQNNFSLLNRRFEDAHAEVCRQERISLLAYSPLAGGVLSGKYADGRWPESSRFTEYRDRDRRTQAMTQRFVNERTLEAARRIAEVARECSLEPATFAIAWCLTRDFLGAAIVGARRPDQLDSTLAAADATLPNEALEACDRISREIPYPMG